MEEKLFILPSSRLRRASFTGLCITVLFAGNFMSTAWGTIFGIRGLQRLIDESQIIVVGDVLDGSEGATLATATVLVTRVLAGSVTAGSVVSVIYNNTGPAVPRKLPQEHGLFFIRQQGGHFEIV